MMKLRNTVFSVVLLSMVGLCFTTNLQAMYRWEREEDFIGNTMYGGHGNDGEWWNRPAMSPGDLEIPLHMTTVPSPQGRQLLEALLAGNDQTAQWLRDNLFSNADQCEVRNNTLFVRMPGEHSTTAISLASTGFLMLLVAGVLAYKNIKDIGDDKVNDPALQDDDASVLTFVKKHWKELALGTCGVGLLGVACYKMFAPVQDTERQVLGYENRNLDLGNGSNVPVAELTFDQHCRQHAAPNIAHFGDNTFMVNWSESLTVIGHYQALVNHILDEMRTRDIARIDFPANAQQ